MNAQTDFRPGYVIEKSGDTLYGNIDYRGDLLMSSICKFKNTDNIIHDYYPDDILAYRFIESKYYVSREVNQRKVFLEYLIKGKVSIYYMRDEKGDHYYLDKDNVGLTEMPYEEGIKYIDDKEVFHESKIHIGLLNYYMQDAPEFQSRIQTIKKPEHKNLIRLAEDYHNSVCKDEKCIIYEKQLPPLKINLEIVSGIVKIEKVFGIRADSIYAPGFVDKYYFQNGIIANFCLPRFDERWYFRTGLLFSRPKNENLKSYYIKVPVHVGYLAPKTFRIRPSVSIGLFSPSYSGGFAVRINKKINLGIQSWINFGYNKFIWIPSQLYNYSILGNLYIDL